ncbi:Spc98 family protein [Massariosphaeria phaeospora]|uniref:Spindle pole body component n=1 Tax=Massariosphaeria phaeospora TaxID=100035 RepID=A0A7C8MCQ3_9PLEO|nr:Spc98 family protein [Massariosphaeria phaeospora]
MLHEILLSLSGHPSALFDAGQGSSSVTPSSIALLSPPETELLSSLGHLSRLHRRTRDHATRIATTHPSTICRAVATAITSHNLDGFQRQVLDVESRILRRDASTVGAYNIVPLAGIVGEFSEWTRVMEWLWEMESFMLSPEAPIKGDRPRQTAVSGAELIDKLRSEAQTGYPDIEGAALHLGTVAETSWLRQLATWLLYGRLPSFGAADFFISLEDEEDLSFTVNHKLLPKFVTRQTASSILFVGKSLNQIRSLPSSTKALAGSSLKVSELELLPVHVTHLSAVTAPITSARLSESVGSIRLSLSRNLLQHLLPREKIIEILTVLHEFFLLGRGEFAMILIAEADDKIQSRHRDPRQTKAGQGIQGIVLKEAEINHTLARSLSVLSTLSGDDDHIDDILDVAMDILHLSVQSSSSHRPGTPGRAKESASALPLISNVAFNDLLLSSPASLTMDIRSPLDLFMAKPELDLYSSIHSYLMALRRAHLHLAQLWRHSSIRREHPPPPGYQFSNSPHGKAILTKRRHRNDVRMREMRKVWATCAAAIFFLAESEAYFQGEVVQESFKHFLHWVSGTQETSSTAMKPVTPQDKQQHDPEALSTAHRQFLSSIAYSLLLTDSSFTQTVRAFFSHVDQLVAYIIRLQDIRHNLDLQEDDGVMDFIRNYEQEEKEVALELDRARRRLDSDLKNLVERLRDIDAERVGASGPASLGTNVREEGQYEPLRIGGVDRLLMKLDWSGEDEDEDVKDLV